MILEYHRPQTLPEALALLGRRAPLTRPLGGGSQLTSATDGPAFAVVDLQSLGLDRLQPRGSGLEIGATVTLEALLQAGDGAGTGAGLQLPAALWAGLSAAIRQEASHNLRQTATVAGTLVAADGRSPFTTALLALDASLTLAAAGADGEEGAGQTLSLGDLLPLRAERLAGKLITAITIPLNARLASEWVARTPADRPLLIAAAAAWPAGRVRLALGGWGAAPTLAMDGHEAGQPPAESGEAGLVLAARNACASAADEWASAEYRVEVAAVLARRVAGAVSR